MNNIDWNLLIQMPTDRFLKSNTALVDWAGGGGGHTSEPLSNRPTLIDNCVLVVYLCADYNQLTKVWLQGSSDLTLMVYYTINSMDQRTMTSYLPVWFGDLLIGGGGGAQVVTFEKNLTSANGC